MSLTASLGAAARSAEQHRHDCQKCAHVWEHSRLPGWTSEQHQQAHTCPACGYHGWETHIAHAL